MDLFRIGSQVGLTPNEVLDMSLDVLKACIQGYTDRIFDQQLMGVQAGYWAGYYNRAKRPSPVAKIIDKMISKKAITDKKMTQKHAPEVDVDGFLNMEARFKERMGALAPKKD